MMFTIMIKYLIENVFFLLGYIGTGNLFPKPLNKEEEEMYFKLYKDGDEDAKRILIERNLRLVVHIAKKYSLKWKDNDDLISIGSIGLIKAVATYDYEKGHRFATYAARCIQNAMVTYWKLTQLLFSPTTIHEQIMLCVILITPTLTSLLKSLQVA